jgi:chemotaxis protein MotB
MCVLLSACVSKGKYSELETNQDQTQTKLTRISGDLAELRASNTELRDKNEQLQNEQQIAQKDIKIEEIEGKLKVTFVDKILFDSGSTKIKDKGKEVLLTLAESFASATDRKVVVEGHTDDVPLGEVLRTKFPSNWELSTARSASVVRFLQEQANIEPERLTATGYSFYQPIASNESEETRKQNRRIEIILVPRQ